MSKVEKMSDRQYLFGVIFLVANKVDTMLEREWVMHKLQLYIN
ncbi:hypothetical protein [Clostridium sp.]|jgi:hypothetical protein